MDYTIHRQPKVENPQEGKSPRGKIHPIYKKEEEIRNKEFIPSSDISLIGNVRKNINTNLSMFDEFWTLYPRKIDKKKSQEKYNKAIKD
jgi:hypothetical protein